MLLNHPWLSSQAALQPGQSPGEASDLWHLYGQIALLNFPRKKGQLKGERLVTGSSYNNSLNQNIILPPDPSF